MNKNKYSIYFLMLTFFSAFSAYASPSMELNTMSNAMFIFMGSAGLALFITYMIWRMNNGRVKRSAPPKVVNRDPVKRPMTVYHKRKPDQVKA